MFEFLDDRNKRGQFLAWSAWVNVWAAVFIFILAIAGTCKFIDKFTRFSGELFGMLIALLFLQQAIKASYWGHLDTWTEADIAIPVECILPSARSTKNCGAGRPSCRTLLFQNLYTAENCGSR
jgi:hypothetical protein